MRRFIYLDTDTLNSYLAQIFDGLIQSQEMEKSAGKKKEKQNHFGSNLGSQIAFKLFGKGIDANAQATYEHLKTVANDEMVRDVQTKIMHDNAFDEFASYLSENGLLGGANIGNFISVEDEFYIFDIAFFQNNKVMAQSNTHTSAFAEIGASINALMKIFFENADEMFVVHPVAIYYDN